MCRQLPVLGYRVRRLPENSPNSQSEAWLFRIQLTLSLLESLKRAPGAFPFRIWGGGTANFFSGVKSFLRGGEVAGGLLRAVRSV
jgi:hypothetical protein